MPHQNTFLIFRNIFLFLFIRIEYFVKYDALQIDRKYESEGKKRQEDFVKRDEQAEAGGAYVDRKQKERPFQIAEGEQQCVFYMVDRRIYKAPGQSEGIVKNNQPYNGERNQQTRRKRRECGSSGGSEKQVEHKQDADGKEGQERKRSILKIAFKFPEISPHQVAVLLFDLL